MIKVLVLPTLEDQINFSHGFKPSNYFLKEFGTEGEVDAYFRGISCVYDLAEYRIVWQNDSSLRIVVDGDKSFISFQNPKEKTSFVYGLEDGSDFVSVKAYRDGTDEFIALSRLLGLGA